MPNDTIIGRPHKTPVTCNTGVRGRTPGNLLPLFLALSEEKHANRDN